MNRFLPSHAVPYSSYFGGTSLLTAANCSIILLAGEGKGALSLVGWLDGWLLSQRLKNSNYHLIIKNACAYRINPSASIAPFRIRIRLAALLIAYQCSISISRARISRWGCGCGCGWSWGGRSGWAAGCTVRQSDSLAVHHSVIDSNGVAVDVSSGSGRDSGIGGCHLLIVVATDGN